MSLTQRIKQYARQYQASDGTTYLLQRVNDAKGLLADGALPRIMAVLGEDEFAKLEGMTNAEFFEMVRQKPELADVVTIGASTVARQLQHGLVGELQADGKPIYYRWVDKPIHALQEGEVNVDFIPDDLAQELAQQINAIGRPAVEGRDVSTFPRQQAQQDNRPTGERDGQAA